MAEQKPCIGCSLSPPEVSFYASNKSRCKGCVSKQGKEWREANRERKRAADKKYYAENKEKLDEINKLWHKKNPEGSKVIKNRWREANQDKIKAIEDNRREGKRAYYREWSKTEAGKLARKAAQLRREARKQNLPCDVSSEFLEELRKGIDICEICDTTMAFGDNHLAPNYPHLDHIVPLKLGGLHVRANLRIICRLCNISRPRNGQDLTEEVERPLREIFEKMIEESRKDS